MKSNRISGWLQNIFNTQDEEINCSECFDLVSQYVDMELSGKDAPREMPQVKQHLGQCPACHEEYETLLDLRRLENEGEAPSTDELIDKIR